MTWGKIFEMLRNIIKKKPEWGTPVVDVFINTLGVGVAEDIFELAISNPGTFVFEVDVSACLPGESGTITIEKKIDGVNWKVIGNAEYDDVDFNTIDDCATAAIVGSEKRAHQWVFYVDAGTDVRVRSIMIAVPHNLQYNYNIKDEV